MSARISEQTLRNKQAHVVDEVMAMAARLGPGYKLPTAQELARQLGVTLTTLDRALARLETRGVIRRRQGSGIYVSERLLEKRIALVFSQNIFEPQISPFYLQLLHCCQLRARGGAAHFSFFLDVPSLSGVSEGPLHRDLEEALEAGRLDGVLLAQRRSEGQLEALGCYGVPLVVLSTKPVGSGLGTTVLTDYESLIAQCVQALLDQGCRTLGLLGVVPAHRELFLKAAAAKGAQVAEHSVLCPSEAESAAQQSHEALGRTLAGKLLAAGRKKLPDALVITDDILARGALPLLEAQRVRIGQGGLRVASHANKGGYALLEWQERITRVEIDPQEIAETMFVALEKRMAGKRVRPEVLSIAPRLATGTEHSGTADRAENLGAPAAQRR